MPTPLEDHGGIEPGPSFPKHLVETHNKVILITQQPPDATFPAFFQSLLLSHVEAILVCVPFTMSQKVSVPPFHPLVSYVPLDIHPIQVCSILLQQRSLESTFVYIVPSTNQVPEELWSVLRRTPQGTTVEFTSGSESHTLLALTNDGIQPISQTQKSFPIPRSSILSEITMDVSSCYTEMCANATALQTDKSPYNVLCHRHPYTPIYDIFFTPYKNRANLKLGEIGVLNGSSMKLWSRTFPQAKLHGFDINQTYLNNISQIPNTTATLVDTGDPAGLSTALSSACSDGKQFDILLEDASHRLEHQLIFLRDALPFIAPGGLLVIEDIFRAIPAVRFEEVLYAHKDRIAKAILVRPEHTFCHSPGWENDRLLFVWVK